MVYNELVSQIGNLFVVLADCVLSSTAQETIYYYIGKKALSKGGKINN